MGDNFAFLLPLTMAMFGCAFLVVWRWGARPALFWGVGFLTGAAGFSMSALPLLVADQWVAFGGDILFTVSFLFYGQALVDRMRVPAWLGVRLAIGAVSIALSALAVFWFGSLHLELFVNDLGCGLLILLPLIAMRRRIARPIDRALFGATALVLCDSFGRASTVLLTAPAGIDGFVDSEYAFVMQLTASVLAVLFALTALAAVALDVVARYRNEASTDPLSSLLNRRGFEDAVLALRPGDPGAGSIVTCDIDHFKRVNDRFGHAVGDQVIIALSGLIRGLLPDGAVAARFGGEEFVVYLPKSSAADAARFAETLRTDFAGQDWQRAGIGEPLTASFGISGTQPSDYSVHDAIARADEALYEAKRGGRNRVSVKRALAPCDPAKGQMPNGGVA